MAEAQLAVASAVIVPDAIDETQTAAQAKRRPSSPPEGSAKRPRFDQYATVDMGANPTQDQLPVRRNTGELEERKRGQRLFGALLGTLSQSSSSTAQKRRTDIEKKQQAKLKLQAEEYDEKKKQRLDALMTVRRREQKKFNKQSMQIRHSNLLAGARFLQTQAEPKLCYKPWQYLPGDEARIKVQIEEAERIIEREVAQFEAANPGFGDVIARDSTEKPLVNPDEAAASSSTVGRANVLHEPSTFTANGDTNPNIASPPDVSAKSIEPPDVSKDQGDDGGEIFLEGEEDTVIY